MKPILAVVVLLALLGVGAAAAYQAAARERDYRALLGRGDVALGEGKTFDAIEAYSGAIALRPDSMLAYLRRGDTYRQRNDLDAAARDLGRASALDPSATRPLEDLGDVQYRRERYSQAADTYAARLRLDDRSAAVAYKLALARYRAGDLDGTLAAITQTLALNDRLADAHYLRGMCLREQNHLPEAARAFEQAVSLSPGMIVAREELAESYGALDRRADELKQLQVLAGLDGENVQRQIMVGLAHAKAGHWDLAVLTLGTALERTPNEPLLYGALGQVWLDRPRDGNDRVYLSKALEALERVASSPAANSELLTLYGRALVEDGDLDSAERTLQQATVRFPVEASAFLLYATVAERLNHFDAARAALIWYGALRPDDGTYGARAMRIGTLSLRLNDAAAAVSWLERAVAAAPNDVRALAALADAQIRAGDRSAAEATIARGLEKDPKNPLFQALTRRTAQLPQ
jgi:tetratricopeptide (TPR) repeat protein